MAIIYKNMLSQAHKNKSPKLNSWEGLGVAPRLASSLPDGEVRPRLARQLHLNFRFPLGTEKIAGEGKRKKSNEHDCSVFFAPLNQIKQEASETEELCLLILKHTLSLFVFRILSLAV